MIKNVYKNLCSFTCLWLHLVCSSELDEFICLAFSLCLSLSRPEFLHCYWLSRSTVLNIASLHPCWLKFIKVLLYFVYIMIAEGSHNFGVFFYDRAKHQKTGPE